MDNKRHYPQHISRQYDADFDHLRDQFLQMGALVEKQLQASMHALTEGVADIAEEVSLRESAATGGSKR